MANIISIWTNLTTPRKALLIGVILATIGAFSILINVAAKPRMAFLYGGLDPAAAGEVLGALEAMNVPADIRGDAIFVPETRRDAIRLTLARQGLPAQGQPGFELLDEMNGFATTSEMFDATYWRAKEGELARTILATPGVKSARVHLGVPAHSAFSRSRRLTTASATLTMSRGRLSQAQATAIRYLIALAVPDLDPEQVAVMDSVNGLILKPGSENPLVQQVNGESDRIHQLEQSLLNLIEARVGPGNARVSVSILLDRERETVSERIIDPDSRVLINRESSDRQESNTGNGNNAVTVASNLPEGDVSSANAASQSQRNETTESARYDLSEVHRQREKMPGAIARVNVAVLLNTHSASQANGEESVLQSSSLSTEEVEAVRELVTAAIGFNEARGDIVTVKAMPFHEAEVGGSVATENGLSAFVQQNVMSILQVVIPAIVVVVLALFVVKPVLTQEFAVVPEGQSASGALPAPEVLDVVSNESAQSPIESLRHIATERADATTTILKSWLGDTEEAA